MYNNCGLSNVTKEYLNKYYLILDEMKEDMTSAELSDSISKNFIVQMIPHHKAAIEMSENLLKYTTFVPLQRIAENIITEQTQSIENMRAIECVCGECRNPEGDVCLYRRRVNSIMRTMFYNMGNAAQGNNINADFMREMIPHHRGAIEMSKNALQYTICKGLQPILNSIITSQQKGIEEMRKLLKCMR